MQFESGVQPGLLSDNLPLDNLQEGVLSSSPLD